MKIYGKHDFPLAKIRRYLERGPIVLVSSRWQGKTNIMRGEGEFMVSGRPINRRSKFKPGNL